MKITTKTTKQELVQFLDTNLGAIKDKDLSSSVKYALSMMEKDESKVSRKDLVDLAKEVISKLGDKVVEILTPATPLAENQTKKLAKGVSKKQEVTPASEEVTEDEPVEEAKEEKVEKSAKKSSKVSPKKKTPKKDGVITLEEESDKMVQLAKVFPETIEIGEDKEVETYEVAHDIKNIEDLHEALANDEEIVFAYYWSKRHLKQFSYFAGWLGQPKSFDNDLDLATCIYVSDEGKVSYQVSRYTEAIYTILAPDFKEEDGLRMAGGIEYQIYRKK